MLAVSMHQLHRPLSFIYTSAKKVISNTKTAVKHFHRSTKIMLQKLLNSLYFLFLLSLKHLKKDKTNWNISFEIFHAHNTTPYPLARHKSVFYRNEWIDRAGFGTEASFNLSYTVIGKVGYLKKQWYSPLELCSKLFEKFHHGRSTVASAVNFWLITSSVHLRVQPDGRDARVYLQAGRFYST